MPKSGVAVCLCVWNILKTYFQYFLSNSSFMSALLL